MSAAQEARVLLVCRIAGILLFLAGAMGPGILLPARYNGAPALTFGQLTIAYLCLASVAIGLLLVLFSSPMFRRWRITLRDWCWLIFVLVLASTWWLDHQTQQRKLDEAARQDYLRMQGDEKSRP